MAWGRVCMRNQAMRLALVGVLMALSHPGAVAATGTDGRWHPGIGDPSTLGWFTVLAYLGALSVCVLCARRLPAAAFWWGVAAALTFLAVNKQLDLQSWMTEVGRDLARQDGWYEHRHRVQVALVVGLSSVFVALALFWGLVLRRHWRDQWLVWVGLWGLMCFIVLRAASFHHVDAWLLSTFLGVRWNGWMEIGCLLLIAVGGRLALGRHPDGRHKDKSP